MTRTIQLLGAAALLAAVATPSAGEEMLSGYTVEELLEPCVEGDADSRWGAAAEAECEQYIRGFTDAYVLVGGAGKEIDICLPDQNRADEIRWAFMRWAHKNFEQRGMPAAEGLLATIRQSFKCSS